MSDMKLVGNWSYPTSIRFGAGRIAELGEAAEAAGMQRPLLVTDPRLADMPMVKDALGLLAADGVPANVFSGIKPNPVAANIEAGLKALKAGGHDGVIAFGGGSALDAGKVIAFMAGQIRPMWDFEDVGDWWTRADPKGILPVVAVPTSQGYGASFGGLAALLTMLNSCAAGVGVMNIDNGFGAGCLAHRINTLAGC